MTNKPISRRAALSGLATAGAAGLAAPTLATAQGQTTTWKIQTSWPGGIGLQIFKDWSNSIVEKTGGELAFEPFGAKDVVGDFQLYDAVKNGVLDAVNPFTIYAQGIIPAAMFLTSYPLGLRNPHEFDTFYYGLGGLEMARELYAKQNMHFVGPIHHGPNIIHSKVPIRSVDDFAGRKMRAPGGMVAELFSALGAKTTLLPGSEIFPALEKGTIDAADYVGPAVNYELGFSQVTDYIMFGPPGVMSIYQPVDLMDLTVNLRVWNALDPELQQLVEDEVRNYSQKHYLTIQKRNIEAMKKFKEEGDTVTRLSQSDLEEFRKAAIPIWFNWASKNEDARAILDIQLEYMMNETVGYLEPEDIEGM